MADQAAFFLQRYLEYRLPGIFERKHRELVFDNGMYLPQTGDLPPGANDIVSELEDARGEAAIIADDTDDIPLVDVKISEDKNPVVRIADGFKYSDREIEAALYAASNGQRITNLRERRMINAVRAINIKSHLLGAYGDAAHGVSGILNNPNVPVVNSSTNLYDPATTPDQILAFFSDRFSAIRTSTYLTAAPNVVLVPDKLHTRLITAYRNTASDSSIKQLILTALSSLGLRDIRPINEASSAELERFGVHAPETNKDRLVFYNLGPDGFMRKFTPYRQTEPERRALAYYVFLVKYVSSVINEYPEESLYVDIPKAS